MPDILALAAPAALAVAGSLYFNAKSSLSYDRQLIFSSLNANKVNLARESTDRVNSFYVLEAHAQDKKHADHIFLIFEGRRWTYRQVYEITLKYGTWLRKYFDVKPKDTIAMDFENSEKYVFVWFGLWSIGAIPTFLNYNLTGKALAHCIRVSATRLVLIDPNVANKVTDEVREELPGIQFVLFTPELEADVMNTAAVREPDYVRSGPKLRDIAMLIYTSGTTGLPKPAVVSWNKAIAGPRISGEWVGTQTSDIFYTCMPLYHSAAALLGLLHSLEAGATCAIGRKFSTARFWQDVRDVDATLIQYVGETCRYLLSAPPQIGPSGENLDRQNKIRVAFGNGLRPDVWNKFKERFGIDTITEFYSATEGSGASVNISKNDFSRGAIGRSGWLLNLLLGAPTVIQMDSDNDTPLRNAKGFCKRAVTGMPGELLQILDGKDIHQRFQGYFRNKEATAAKVIRDVFKKGDAYFRTGDLVRLDADGSRLYFLDRLGDTFRWKSENVSTNEVAECLNNHPSVQETNVYGVKLPHYDGRAGCAAVVLSENPSPQLMSSLAELGGRELPPYAVPLFLRVTKTLETTGTNKHQKHVLRLQGVDPGKSQGDELYWLKKGTYVKFGDQEWQELNNGRVKL